MSHETILHKVCQETINRHLDRIAALEREVSELREDARWLAERLVEWVRIAETLDPPCVVDLREPNERIEAALKEAALARSSRGEP